mmetsp:Transcript_39355/g.104489  ORF Transcript_39355/g.104489 Transcript_39355/m.104489 type:complete len:101 (+) Transcript_39355:686-988(+)
MLLARWTSYQVPAYSPSSTSTTGIPCILLLEPPFLSMNRSIFADLFSLVSSSLMPARPKREVQVPARRDAPRVLALPFDAVGTGEATAAAGAFCGLAAAP